MSFLVYLIPCENPTVPKTITSKELIINFFIVFIFNTNLTLIRVEIQILFETIKKNDRLRFTFIV